tara:strand:+ start:7595 stop:9217 length:1623 start_codon:yes stop_codon:yes gene_type:complete
MAKEVLEMEVKSNIGEVAKDTDKLVKSSGKAKKGVGGIATAFKGVGVAMKAAGIGIVVALIAKLMEVLGKNQKVLDAFDTGMTALSIAFNDLFSFLSENIEPVTEYFKELFENPAEKIKEMGTAIKEGLVDRFNEFVEVLGLAGKALGQLVTGEFSAAFDTIKEAGKQVVDVYTGVDDSFDKITGTIITYTKETLKQANAITELNKAAQLAEVEFAKLNAEFLREAEISRQVRDDVSKTFAVRIKANEELSKTLAKQSEEQKKQLQIQIDAAKVQVGINDSIENKVALGNAENAMLELNETITGQISEQLTNQVALEKELLDAQNQLRLEGLSGMEQELEDLRLNYEAKIELARLAEEDITAITAKYAKDQFAIRKIEADKQIGLDKLVKDQKVAMAQNGLSLIKDIAGESSAIGKAAAITQTTISGIQSVQEAFKSGSANVPMMTATGGTFGFLQAGLAGAFSAVQIAKIAGVGGGGGGGGVGGGGGASAAATPAPQMMSGAFDITGGVAPEPMKAFVVTDEMTNSQDQLANIRRRATI